MEYTRLEIFNKYLEIKKDIIDNLNEVYNRQNYYSKKYRGNISTDINVAISEEGDYKKIQIFVRAKGIYIKEIILYNLSGYYKSTIKSNLING